MYRKDEEQVGVYHGREQVESAQPGVRTLGICAEEQAMSHRLTHSVPLGTSKQRRNADVKEHPLDWKRQGDVLGGWCL